MKTQQPTKAEHRRMEVIKDLGCLLCKLDMGDMRHYTPCDVHHVTDGFRRLGHAFTFGACPFVHHRAKVYGSVDGWGVEEKYGMTQRDMVRLQDRLVAESEDNTVGAKVRAAMSEG
ncbi:Ref family recombination enhancement nuclease [Salinisphaera sp.]|uniref:Ref family recombination enhancement nuclease n=1 Tax=Salinisphaera sp. TaxID=1914330 RepID=UPI0025F8ADD0|nr:Ref family recombination enhancement nuclease [Salinisphaera sp.]|tara:strand:+ start:16375 stop:16722 length:348 start_codon:yes stop_codon:yes gene_type:complete